MNFLSIQDKDVGKVLVFNRHCLNDEIIIESFDIGHIKELIDHLKGKKMYQIRAKRVSGKDIIIVFVENRLLH